MARKWVDAGARRLHLVDLNGAFAGTPKNYSAIKSILKEVGDDIPVQLGGGIRDLDTIEKYIDGGLRYVIIGTAAVKNPGSSKTPAAPSAATSSWAWTPRTARSPPTAGASSPATRWWIGQKFEDWGVESIIYTDIGRDGMLSGINIDATVKAGPGFEHPRDRLGRPVEHGRHRAARAAVSAAVETHKKPARVAQPGGAFVGWSAGGKGGGGVDGAHRPPANSSSWAGWPRVCRPAWWGCIAGWWRTPGRGWRADAAALNGGLHGGAVIGVVHQHGMAAVGQRVKATACWLGQKFWNVVAAPSS